MGCDLHTQLQGTILFSLEMKTLYLFFFFYAQIAMRSQRNLPLNSEKQLCNPPTLL